MHNQAEVSLQQEQAEISLQQILDFREKKSLRLQQYRIQYPGCITVSLGMNVPGPRKNNEKILQAFLNGKDAITSRFSQKGYKLIAEKTVLKPAGNLAIFVLQEKSAVDIKADMIALEEESPAARLYDIDVYREDGTQVGREELHVAPRKCFLCGNDAKNCGRSRAHSVQELERRMYEILDAT